MLGGLRVPPVEFSYKPLSTFDTFKWPPLLLIDPISLPKYVIFELSLEDLVVHDYLYFKHTPQLCHRLWGVVGCIALAQ